MTAPPAPAVAVAPLRAARALLFAYAVLLSGCADLGCITGIRCDWAPEPTIVCRYEIVQDSAGRVTVRTEGLLGCPRLTVPQDSTERKAQ